MTLSVIIITKNEAANIGRCLESVAFADERIVLDSGSTDNTLDIARSFTEHVYVRDDWQGYGVQKQRALAYATGDWVLNLDADESIDDTLRDAIKAAMAADEADAYQIPIHMHFYGKALPYSASPSRHVRLFKRAGADYSDDIVHEKIQLPNGTRIAKIALPICHHSFQDVSHVITKLNRYSSYSAHARATTRKPPALITVIAATLWMFFRCFILQRGFLDGEAGFLMAIHKAEGSFYRGMKQRYRDAAPKGASS